MAHSDLPKLKDVRPVQRTTPAPKPKATTGPGEIKRRGGRPKPAARVTAEARTQKVRQRVQVKARPYIEKAQAAAAERGQVKVGQTASPKVQTTTSRPRRKTKLQKKFGQLKRGKARRAIAKAGRLTREATVGGGLTKEGRRKETLVRQRVAKAGQLRKAARTLKVAGRLAARISAPAAAAEATYQAGRTLYEGGRAVGGALHKRAQKKSWAKWQEKKEKGELPFQKRR